MNEMPDVYRSRPPFTGHIQKLSVSNYHDVWRLFDPVEHISDHFACSFEGAFVASQTKVLRWRLTSDDGSELFVNGEKIISNGFIHEAPIDRFSELHVVRGETYRVRCHYFQAFGEAHWALYYSYEGDTTWTAFYSNVSLSSASNCSQWCDTCVYEECDGCISCEDDDSPTNVHVVVNAYNENLRFIPSFLTRIPFSRLFLYCKGGILSDKRCIHIPNFCCESHGYVTHIMRNFDSLAEITLFLRASILTPELDWLVCKNSFTLAASLTSVDDQKVWPPFAFDTRVKQYYFPDFFTMPFYKTQIGDSYRRLCDSRVQPLSRFVTEVLGMSMEKAHRVNFFHGSIFGARNTVLQNVGLHTFENIKREFEYCDVGAGQEVGHYMERSWMTLLQDDTMEEPHIPSSSDAVAVARAVPRRKSWLKS